MISTEQRDQIKALRTYIEGKNDRIKRLEALRHPPEKFWTALKDEVEKSIESSKLSQNTICNCNNPYEPGDPARSWASVQWFAGAINTARGIVADVDHADDRLDSLKKEVAERKKQLAALESKNRPTAVKSTKAKEFV